MKGILLGFIAASILYMTFGGVLRRKGRSKAELDALSALLYMFAVQKGSDANGILFRIERYAGINRGMINGIRTGHLKNDAGHTGIEHKRKHERTFSDIAEVLYENGLERTAEYMEGLAELKKRNMERAAKIRGEIVNSAGIVFTMMIMFLIIIYFLAPYAGIFGAYGF